MKKFFIIALVFSLMISSSVFAFSDVSEEHWAYSQIEEMYFGKIISGFDDGTFRPNNPITREQVASVLTNFFKVALRDGAKTFEDVTPGYWSAEYSNLIGQYMPISEIDGKYYFRPFDNATRVEIAETIIKLIRYDGEATDYEIIEKFNDKDIFSENDKKYISLVAKNNIMVGDDKAEFRPNETITRAEFCAMIYNIYYMKKDLQALNSSKVVMTVNGEDILFDEFRTYFGLQKMAYESMFGSDEIWTAEIDGQSLYDIVKEITKEGTIQNKVKVQKANELGIELTEEELESIKENSYNESGLEICDFYGITPEQLYKINLEGIIISKVVEFQYNQLDHSQHEHLDINSTVNNITYNARHILLSTEGKSEEEKAKIKEASEALLSRIKNGEDFASLAKEYSADTGSKANGGLYESISIGEFVPEFEEAALSLNDGMLYPDLVESVYGYHIIKLESKVESTRELTDEEKQEIMSNDVQPLVEEWTENAIVNVNEEVYNMI